LIDVNADDLQPVVDTPGELAQMQARADADRHVALTPQLVAGQDVVVERMAVIEHAAAEPMRDHWGLKVFGQHAYFSGSIKCAAANEDQRVLGLGEQRNGLLERGAVERIDAGLK
jgi:hypothetical protein